MHSLLLPIIAIIATLPYSHARFATTVVVYVTVPPSNSPTAAAIGAQAETAESTYSSLEFTSLSTGGSRAPSAVSEATISSSQSIHEATSSQTSPTATSTPTVTPEISEPGASSLGSGEVDTEGGASGSSSGAFHLSKGGLAAILIVVILVVVFGSESSPIHAIDLKLILLPSHKHRLVHHRKAPAMDHAPDSQACFSPLDGPRRLF